MLSSLRGKGFVEVCSNCALRAKTSADLLFIQRSNKHFWPIDWDSMGWSSLQSFSLHASKSCELILSLTFITLTYVPNNHTMFYEHQLPGGWSFWYLFSVESRVRCWRKQLKNTTFFHESYLSCGSYNSTVQSFLNHSCPITDRQNIGDLEAFNFGMFIEALKSRVVESTTDFHHKFFYCFWWGLRSLR